MPSSNPEAERIARIRMNPDVGRVEWNRRVADVDQTAFREPETRPPSELLLADREVVIVPGVEHSRESRHIGRKFNHPVGRDAHHHDDLVGHHLRRPVRGRHTSGGLGDGLMDSHRHDDG